MYLMQTMNPKCCGGIIGIREKVDFIIGRCVRAVSTWEIDVFIYTGGSLEVLDILSVI